LLGYAVVCVVRRDWLLASFMLLPFPAIIVWLFAVQQGVGLAAYGKGGFAGGDQGVAFTFHALGGAAGTFIRFRQRLLKTAVLAIATLFILAMVWRFAESNLNPVISLFISFCFVIFLLSPCLLQNRVVHSGSEIESWDEALLEQSARRT
jgi:tryptophan-rich sensory protein